MGRNKLFYRVALAAGQGTWPGPWSTQPQELHFGTKVFLWSPGEALGRNIWQVQPVVRMLLKKKITA